MLELTTQIFSLAAAVVTVVLALRSLYNLVHPLLRRTVLKHLYDALKNTNSITNQAELNYQVKCYVQPKFICRDKQYTVKKLIKELKKPGGLFAITGKPASGKTTAMRYLYCRLSKTRKCVYVQMQTIRCIDDFRCRIKAQAASKWKEGEPVIAFIDGVDEAISFHADPSTPAADTFFSVFLDGKQPKIFSFFSDCGLNLDCIVISLRPEFLDSPDYLRKYSKQNLTMQVCQLQKLSEKDIIKIFKSLKVLQRMDKSSTPPRHNGRYPSIWEERKYVKLLRKILEGQSDSIFYYPMFVRYAYAFMKEYEKDLGSKNLTPASNMAKSFKVLLKAALKWEFHVYYDAKGSLPNGKTAGFKQFEEAISSCMDQVIQVMLKQDADKAENPWIISREKLGKIVEKHAYSEEDTLVIAHCILTSDDDGCNFGFCHNTFYEFYLAKYLLLRADYPARKHHLLSADSSKNLQQMYYTILCDEKDLCEKLSSSIIELESEELNIGSCVKLQLKPNIHVASDPKMPVVGILSYLPFIKSFFYQEVWFTQKQVEQMLSGVLDLTQANWESLDYAGGLAPAHSIKALKLQGMPLNDVQALANYVNLRDLDIRLDASHEQAVYDSLKLLRKIPLNQIHVYTEDGRICEEIQKLMNQGDFFSETVLLDVLEYSSAYVVIFQLKQSVTSGGGIFRFHVSYTDPDRAFEEYSKKDSEKDLQILRAVFELEAGQSAGLSPRENRFETEAVLWNGLSLAKFYMFHDIIDEDKSAYQIYERLEPYVLTSGSCDENKEPNGSHSHTLETGLNILEAGSKPSVYLGADYGKRLIFAHEHQRARQWLTYTYQYADRFFSENESISVAIRLYISRVRCKETDLGEFKDALQQRIERSPSFEENSDSLWFLRTCCAELFERWKKGTAPPEKLDSLTQMVLKKTRVYIAKKDDRFEHFSAVYLRLIFENRMEHVKAAAKLLDELTSVTPAVDETRDDRREQGHWIQYMEQRLYYLFLTEQREEAIKTANELMSYPYRTADLWKNSYQRIIDWCVQSGEEETGSVDKHQLWECFWF